MGPSKLLLPLPDYQRIFRVIYSVLDGRASSERSCIFFALVGAAILNEHYKLNATPVAGAAQFTVNANDSLVTVFGQLENGELISKLEAFHCWVECDGYAIDFMAPIFHESMRSSGCQSRIPRRMFQKRLELMKPIHGEFPGEGAFFFLPNMSLTQAIITNFGNRNSNTDFGNICIEWFKRPPKRIPETLAIRNDLGEITTLKLQGPNIESAW